MNYSIEKNKNVKFEKGITLITLIVSIIVLLLLAGISISMLTGNNGILVKTGEAKVKTDEASIREEEQLEELVDLTDVETGSILAKTTNGAIYIVNNPKNNNFVNNPNISMVIQEKGKVDGEKVESGEVPIPLGATYIEGTEKTGVVIEYKGSEFVWVPVKDAIYDSTKDDNLPKSQNNGSLTTNHNYTPMAINVGTASSPDYRELLYTGFDTSKGSYLLYYYKTNYQGTSSQYREPDIVSTYDTEAENYLKNIGFKKTIVDEEEVEKEVSDPEAFSIEMQTYYKNMLESVEKYGGFYVGRYETSLDATTVVASKKSPVESGTGAIMPMSAATKSGNMWYGIYDKQKMFSGKNIDGTDNSDSLVSSMIWGSQYDAMLNWMLNNEEDKAKIQQKTNGNHQGSAKGAVGCGISVNDKINNIYDLEGNEVEWTLEACNTKERSYRRRTLQP